MTAKILVIDDEPAKAETLLVRLEQEPGIHANAVTPEQLSSRDLSDVDVVAVDQYLKTWPTRDRQPVGLRPADGIALAAVLRGHLDAHRPSNPAAIVLQTGAITDLAKGLPEATRESLLASQHGLEWVLPIEDTKFASRLSMLATASSELNGTRLRDAESLAAWLGLKGSPWRGLALEQVTACRPPLHTLADMTHGRSLLRWFLHRVLPYPTFLLSDVHAAVALRLTPSEFGQIASGTSDLADRIGECRYLGQLSSFLGRRWWRAGLRTLIDDVTDGWVEPAALARSYEALHGAPVIVLPLTRPVVAIDADEQALETPVDASQAERLLPDGWPPFADEPWASRVALDEDDDLRRLIRPRFDGPGDE